MSDDPNKPSEEPQSANPPANQLESGDAGSQDSEAKGSAAVPGDDGDSGKDSQSLSDSMAADSVIPADSAVDEELPDIEPLTPELVEEEAIRGDFMLRWAVIFLALLFGFSKMTDTRTLVHVRSGQQMQSSGFLPSSVDTMSFSAEGKPAVNVSWLFDHIVGVVWSIGGDTGLSVFKAVVSAFIAWILSRISVAGMPTWWSSICAVFAIVACSGDFAATTELVTLLGMVILLGLLHQHREGKASGLMWKLPVLIAVWCNLDPRAWIGAFAAVLYAGGMLLASRRSASNEPADGQPLPEGIPGGQGLTVAAALGLAALLVNPFPLNSLLSATTIYSVEYPTMQEQRPLASTMAGISFDGRIDYFSMLDPDAFTLFDHTQIAGIAIVLVSLIVLVYTLNAADRGYLLMLIGLSALAIYATHELPVAALSAAMIAGTVGQRWYRRNFNLQYSVDAKELLFSRGGRAVTVFALAFLGFCVVAGRLPGNTPVGPGFERDTQTTIDTLGVQLAELPTDARILHTRIDQGDILIWHGRKSMIDSRVIPFGRMGNPESIAAKHRSVLRNLLLPQPVPEQDEEKKKQAEEQATAVQYLDEFAVTHVMPRLSPPGTPDYRSIQMLASRPDWLMVQLGPSAAFLEKIDPNMSAEDRNAKLPAFGMMAFQDAESTPLVRVDFARGADFYQKYVYRERAFTSEYVRQAEHYLWLAERQMQSVEQMVASLSLTTLAVRQLNKALYDDQQNGYAYQKLGMAYLQLGVVESVLSGQQGDSTRQEMRYLQSIMALQQALKSNPDNVEVWALLYQQYLGRQRLDLASQCLGRWLSLQDTEATDIQREAMIKEMFDMQRQLAERVRDSQTRVEEFLQNNPLSEDAAEKTNQLIAVASDLAQSGFSLQALELLQEYGDLIRQNPVGQSLMGSLLLETGSIEEGFRMVNQLSLVAREQPAAFVGIRWHFPAALSQLCLADYVSAIDFWTQQLKEIEQAAVTPEPNRNILLSAPLGSELNLLPQALISQWPVGHLNAVSLPVTGIARAQSDVRFLIALCHIEDGNVQAAKIVLQAMISEGGDSPYRQLASYYLSLLDKNGPRFIDQHTLNNWEEFEFVADAGSEQSPEQPAPEQPAQEQSAQDAAGNAEPAVDKAPEAVDKSPQE